MNNRIAWIDNVKMVAMLFVIIGHTWRIIHCDLPVWMSLFIGTFNMPLFVMMTGYTSVKSIDRIDNIIALRDYLIKITKRILVPSAFFWSVAVILLTILKYAQFRTIENERIVELVLRALIVTLFVIGYYYRNGQKGKVLFNVLCICAIPIAIKGSSYWFLSMIWIVCSAVAIGSYITHKIRSWGGYLSLCILSFGIYLILSKTYTAIGASVNIDCFVHYLLIGYALSKFKLFDYLYKYSIPLSAVFLVIGIASLGICDNPFNPISYIPSITLSLFFMIMTKKLSSDYNRFSYWGAQTLALYMVHAFIIYVCYKLPFTYTIEGVKYLLYAIPAAAIVTFMSMLIIKVLSRYEITRAYCLGELK